MDHDEREARLHELRDPSAREAVDRLKAQQAELARKMEEAQRTDFDQRLAEKLREEVERELNRLSDGPTLAPQGGRTQSMRTREDVADELMAEDRGTVKSQVTQPYEAAMDRVVEFATDNPSHGQTADGLIHEATRADPVRQGTSPSRAFGNVQKQQQKRAALRRQMGILYRQYGREAEGREE